MKFFRCVFMIILVLYGIYAEYRFIMHNAHPYIGENNTVYIEVFGRTDEYLVGE